MRKTRHLIAALLICSPLMANAVPISFEYTFADGAVLAGELFGAVQGDGDTIFIDAFGVVTLDGVAFNSIEPSDICSISDFNACGLQPLVSISGAVMDVFVCSLGFDANNNCLFAADGGFFLDTTVFGARALLPNGVDHTETFAADRWSVDVPEPGTVALLGLGLLGMGFARRRKAA